MILFKKIRWKNFLSTGNTFVEIDLNKSQMTLMIGANGSGKSTMLDALTFALFNRPFRLIKKEQIIEEIRKIYDPELPVNIYELGLIYDIKVEDDKFAKIKMTLTTPNCPVAESLPKEVKNGAMQVEGIEDVDLELVWDPPWNKDMMSEAAKLELNL